ncbi:hypothetical protein ACQJBY_062692 [Aegilops geniculata]
MAEQGKKSGEQDKKRPRFSEKAEGSGAKKSSAVAVITVSPAELAVPSPVAPRRAALSSPSPVAKAKPVTGPLAVMPPALPVPSPVATKTRTLAELNPVPITKSAATVAVTSPVAATPPAPSPAATRVLAAQSPAATKTPTLSPVATVAVTSPVTAMPSAPSPAATRLLEAQSPVATKTPTPSPVATAKPAAVVKRDEEGAEHNGGAMLALAAEEEEPANLDLPKKLFHCAACRAPLKPPVFKCEKEHFVCCACGGGGDGRANRHCGPCGHDASYTHSEFMDGVVGAYKVPCPYKQHGCASSIVYHAAADHKAKCAHAPCYCFECMPPFEGSPAELLRHLTAPSGKHSWLTDKIKYESSHPLVVQAPSGDYRCLLLAEDDSVFLLAVGAGRGPAGRRPVNVVCVRGNADADSRPLYTGVLWVDGPPATAGHLRGSVQVKGDVASCSVPGEVDMEQGWLHAHVNPNMLHGESGEVHLRLRITKFP